MSLLVQGDGIRFLFGRALLVDVWEQPVFSFWPTHKVERLGEPADHHSLGPAVILLVDDPLTLAFPVYVGASRLALHLHRLVRLLLQFLLDCLQQCGGVAREGDALGQQELLNVDVGLAAGRTALAAPRWLRRHLLLLLQDPEGRVLRHEENEQ